MKDLADVYEDIAQSATQALEKALSNLYSHKFDEDNIPDDGLIESVCQETRDFVFGTSAFGQELQQEDGANIVPTIDCNLVEMLENLHLDASGGTSGVSEEEALSTLTRLDFEIEKSAEQWRQRKTDLTQRRDEPGAQAELAKFQNYFMDTQSAVCRVPTTSNAASDIVKTACTRTLLGHILDVRTVKEGLRDGEESVQSDATFLSNLARRDPTTLLFAFIPMMLHDYGHLSHKWSDTLLKLLRLGLVSAWTLSDKGLAGIHERLVAVLPKTLKTARKWFTGLEAKTTTMAMCPKCCLIYEAPEIPARCTFTAFPASQLCDEPLLTSRSERVGSDVVAIPFPILPVEVNDFASWKARWLQRPGLEKILRVSQEYMGQPASNGVMNDIRDSAGVRDLPHPDGGKFFDGRQHAELRTSWTLFYDAFNPFFNKASGKTASSAVLGLACQNLPPSLKHQPENLYLMTILPKDPSVVQVSFALRVLFRKLNKYWKDGIFIENTPDSPDGFRDRSIIANLVTDMLGGSKLGGHAQHNSGNYFCSLCLLQKQEINRTDPACFPPRTRQGELENALQWRDAASSNERDSIFKKTGVRWSALYELEYWDPTKMLAADPMHNLFLGLVQHHCRIVMGIDFTKRKNKASRANAVYNGFMNPNMDQLESGRAVIATAQSVKPMERLTKNVLWMLCAERGIDLQEHASSTKKDLADLLWDTLTRMQNSHRPVNTPLQGIPTDLIIGEDFIDACKEEMMNVRTRPVRDGMTKNERKKLHRDIASTIRPATHRGPPVNLGEESHGKLKADELRSLAEFDLAVTASEIWARENQPANADPDLVERNNMKFEATMYLCMAIRAGTSFRTSREHAERYTTYMVKYLDLILELYPGSTLTPNQHKALHVGPGLLQFGPAPGWWMFPFERLIGILQKTNHNFKIGQLERTMVQTFCNAANIRGMLLDPRCPLVLQQAFPIINKAWKMDTLLGKTENQRTERVNAIVQTTHQRSTSEIPGLDVAIQAFLCASSSPRTIYTVREVKIGKYGFSSKRINASQSRIFFEVNGNLFPGEIQNVFRLEEKGTDLLAVRRFHRPQIAYNNVFARFHDFGLVLVSEQLGDLEVVCADESIRATTSRSYGRGQIALKDSSRSV